LAGVLP